MLKTWKIAMPTYSPRLKKKLLFSREGEGGAWPLLRIAYYLLSIWVLFRSTSHLAGSYRLTTFLIELEGCCYPWLKKKFFFQFSSCLPLCAPQFQPFKNTLQHCLCFIINFKTDNGVCWPCHQYNRFNFMCTVQLCEGSLSYYTQQPWFYQELPLVIPGY